MFKQILYFSAFLVFVQSAKLPKTWETCKKDDPKLNDCLKGKVEAAILDLANNGNPPLGVFKLDPLHFERITVDQGQGPVSIKLDFHDLDIIGFKNIQVQELKTDWKTMELKIFLPKLTLAGKYKMNGKVMILPVMGEGDCQLVFTKYTAITNMKIKEITKGGKKYYEVVEFPFTMDSEDVQLEFKNLFKGDKALGDNMNSFLNANSKDIIKELGPAISKAFGTGFKNIANRIFSKVSVKEISP